MMFRVINKRRIWLKKINNVRINYVEHLEKFIAPIKLGGETLTQPAIARPNQWSHLIDCVHLSVQMVTLKEITLDMGSIRFIRC